MNSENEKLNPQITDVEIGVRTLRTIKIYPLSMADQVKLTDLITEGLQLFFEGKDQSDMAVVALIADLIKKNLGRLIGMMTDEDGDALLSELTNLQTTEIATAVWAVNYEPALKNAQSLFERVKNISPSERPLPQSLKDTLGTDLNTSTDEALKMEA